MGILIGFFIVLFAALIVAIRIMKTREIEQENRLMQSYMDSMQEFYAAIQDRIEATRRYRHDLARHIQTLESLLGTANKDEDIMECMDELRGKYDELKKQEYCCDEIINSVLTIKKQQCREKNVPFEIHTEDGNYTGIQEVDMVGLLHNLLDNALEANERIPENGKRGIRFAMGKRDGEIWIETENYIRPGEVVTMKTWKEEKEEHGIGTRIIDSLVEKYHGRKEIFVDQDNHLFTKKIYLLPNEEESAA